MPHRARSIAALVVLVAVVGIGVGLFLASGWLGGITRHDAGDGPLGTNAHGRADWALGLAPVNAGKTYSVAERICILTGDPVVLESVRPIETLGSASDWSYLGAQLRHGPANDMNRFLSKEGYPPDAAGTFEDVAGATVDAPCEDDPGDGRTEAILGFATTPTSTGGGWQSVEIAYRQGIRRYVLVIHDVVVLCGPATASVPECSSYLESATPG